MLEKTSNKVELILIAFGLSSLTTQFLNDHTMNRAPNATLNLDLGPLHHVMYQLARWRAQALYVPGNGRLVHVHLAYK